LDGLEVIRGEVICLALLCRIEGRSLKDPSVTRELPADATGLETSMDR
jgi:hypothetical protein